MEDPFSSERVPVISTHGLRKVFGNVVAVNDLNLQVLRGDVFGFLGPNGSGKTTTIRMLLGLIRPTAGKALLFDTDTSLALPSILRRVGAIIETPVFYPYLSGIDNLRVVAVNSGMVAGKRNEKRLAELLELVELSSAARQHYSKYSLGMKQRLAIAATLLHDAELILLDEPTNGLDPSGVIEIRNLIKRLSAAGKTIFLSSHILSEVQQVCNRVGILRKGNMMKQGSVSELLRDNEQIEVRMDRPEQMQAALAVLQQARQQGAHWIADINVERNRRDQEVIMIDAPAIHSPEVTMILAYHQLFVAELHPREGNLEDLYLQVTTPATDQSAGRADTSDQPQAKGVAQ